MEFRIVSVETWDERRHEGAAAPAAPVRAESLRTGRTRVKLGVAGTVLQLWRAKVLMLLVLAPILLIGIILTFAVPTKYAASTRLLVRLGQEYVFDPIVGDAAKGAFPQQEEVLQAETELARSPVIAERVIKHIGLQQLYPDLANARAAAAPGHTYAVDQQALESFGKDLNVSSAPKSSILRMTFAHEQPQVAADTLNAFVAEYLTYRREILSGRGVAGLTEQRGVIENRLKEADDAMRGYLLRNGMSDFEAENAAATKLFADISDEMSKVEASRREAEAKKAGLRRQLASTSKDVDLYVETTSEADLMKLRVEREDLLTRYLPDSRAVQDINRRITQLEAFLKTAPAAGLRRIGPNPTWQALEADEAVQTANISAMQGREAELKNQKEEAQQRLAALSALQPEYLRLKRDRDALEASAGTFATREQTERARSELASHSVDNISVYEPARAPSKGDSPKRFIIAAAALLGLMTALAIGLLRIWSIRSFPNTGSIERTLGMRVLASTRER
jgi:uncharacterized protein involved in exopolysaccharide biosynthesis